MSDAASAPSSKQAPFAPLVAPGFITFTDVTPAGADTLEFVISNEATGKFFLANRATVQFFSILKDTGSIQSALLKSGIPQQQGDALVKRLVQSGLLVRNGKTQSDASLQSAPIESKLISLRWDIFDASRITDAFGWLGRILYSPIGYLAWFGVLLAMAQALLSNTEKLSLGLRQIFDADWRQFLIFGVIYIALKIVHEMGHALAYRTMCAQENLHPGPIRMGISIFAFTPFPFTDVTGAWRIRSVFRRVMIGAGGIYFETWVIALLTLFWAQTQSGMLQTIVLQVAVFAGLLALLFNLNPAIKLDGYYMLTDYLRRPNLSGRASLAARNTLARVLGGQTPRIVMSDLTYWVLSYTYRWTIFAGIFWLLYQFDKRLAPVAVGIIVMTLIGRPFYNSLKYAAKLGVKPIRSTFALALLAAGAAVLFVPFPDRILLPGQMRTYETQFIEAPESGILAAHDQKGFGLHNDDIAYRITDVSLRREMLENLSRGAQVAAAERQGLQTEIDSFKQTTAELTRRLDAGQFSANDTVVWTPLAASRYDGSWVTSSGIDLLGAFSTPTQPYLRLRLDQSLLERDISLVADTPLKVRAVHDPDCEFLAQLQGSSTTRLAIDDSLTLRARPVSAQDSCAAGLANGGAVIARLDTRPRSVVERLKFAGSRLLQNRLQIHSQ